MSNPFDVLGNFESDNPQDFKQPKPHNLPNKQKLKKANKKVAEKAAKPLVKAPEVFSTQHNKRGRGHVDRNRMAPPKRGGKIYDRTKPGKIKKGGAGKGNWGKNDGTAQLKALKKASEEEGTEKPVEETKVENGANAEEAEATPEEEQQEDDSTITYEEYLANQATSTRTKKPKNKIDNSNLDASLKKKTVTANEGVNNAKKGHKSKNKRKTKGMDLKDFLQKENVSNKGNTNGKSKQHQAGNRKSNNRKNPNLKNMSDFPPLN